MANPSATPTWQRALIVLTSTVVAVVVVSCLYWAQTILIPVALALLLTFLLAPLVKFLQRYRLGRTPAVLVVVVLAGVLCGGLVWLVTAQVVNLVAELPDHTDRIKGKIKAIRGMGQGTRMESLDQMLRDITGELKAKAQTPAKDSEPKPMPVVLRPEGPEWFSHMPNFLRPLLEMFGGGALALVLVVFMLLKREKLRDRMIWLVGQGRITLTTKALDEAGQKLSRFLFAQAAINFGFGALFAIGLFVIGVKYALLWGFLTALLRYVPYIGSFAAAVMPLTLSFALSESWGPVIAVLVYFVVLELLTANVLEPRIFGHSLGVSEVALLVAAAFWTFLWGPIGLVLANPLMVCLVVLGKYVPHLEFLSVLLGNEPALEPEISYYQRLLARDQDEATQLILERVKATSVEQVYDELIVPALSYTRRDRERDTLTEADEQFVLTATREIVEDLGERQTAAEAANPTTPEPVADQSPKPPQIRILGCPARDRGDRLGLQMLQQVLDPTKWTMEIVALETLTAELVEIVADKEPAIICIGSLPPGGLAHTRYLCKRLRARFPEARIIAGRWGLQDRVEQNQEQLRAAGADLMTTTLLETRQELNSLQAVLQGEQVPMPADRETKESRAAVV